MKTKKFKPKNVNPGDPAEVWVVVVCLIAGVTFMVNDAVVVLYPALLEVTLILTKPASFEENTALPIPFAPVAPALLVKLP